MLTSLLNSILGTPEPKEPAQESGGLGSWLIIGIIVFVLLGGFSLFKKPEEKTEE